MMICPVCKEDLLSQTTLDSNLPVFRCSKCEGIWLPANDYLNWVRTSKPAPAAAKSEEPLVPTMDVQALKLCPSCKRFMGRFKVLPNVEFYLDRCRQCNGVWLDKNEWDVLVARQLHDKVNLFFTQPWQAKIREEETKAALDKLYLDKFGTADYGRVKEIWGWLKDNPHRSMLLAFLQADNPYKI
jgi:Zn-finger nucleic acid-binding protein